MLAGYYSVSALYVLWLTEGFGDFCYLIPISWIRLFYFVYCN